MNKTEFTVIFASALAILLITVTSMWLLPKYGVYRMEMRGKAILAEAESSRQVAVREALALKDSSVHRADAERIRAQGVADSNNIVADSLGGPEGYLRYLAIDAMRAQAASQSTTIYVPTEANIPITEAGRFNRPAHATKE